MILGLAPMDGITDSAMRIITKQTFDKYNDNPEDELFLRTEFMSANGYCINPAHVARHIIKTNYETPLIAQIFGGDEKYLTKAALDIEQKYGDKFYGININMGCPANKVVNSGGGSGMLIDKEKSLNIIKNLRSKLKGHFSIKTRTGLNEDDKENQMNFLIEASQYCDMMIIHGRTLKAGYSGDCDRDFIYKLNENIRNTPLILGLETSDRGARGVKNTKIIGNGGIKSFEEIDIINGLDGIMIGQAAMGNPRIFTNHEATLQEKRDTILTHLDISIKMEIEYDRQKDNYREGSEFILEFRDLEEIESITQKEIDKFEKKNKIYSVIEFRKHLFNYVKGIRGSKEFKIKCSSIYKYQELKDEINKFFDEATCHPVPPPYGVVSGSL